MASMLRTTEKLLIPTGILFTRRLFQPVMTASVRVRSTARTTVADTWGYQYRPTPHGRDGLYIKTSYGITLGYFRIESILPIPERISVEEREQCLTV